MRAAPGFLRLEPFAEFEEAGAAPGAFRGEDPAPRWSLRRALQNHLAMYVGGLVFMIFGVVAVAEQATSAADLIGGEAVILLLSVMYVGTPLASDARSSLRWAYVGLFGAVMIATAGLIGVQFSSFGVYFAIMLATLIPWRISRFLIVGWGLVLIVISIITSDWTPALIALIGVGIGYAVGSGIEQGRVAQKLRRVEVRASQLAVVAERERIARDLHDILGHSLTAVAIKSGLAGRLVDVDPDAARTQIEEVTSIARQALADVRATAAGMRQVRLATEIAGARSVLEAAGIEAITPTAIDAMDEARTELLGYAVREAVTNVVRHSEARRCVITSGRGWVAINDDGRGLGHVDPSGRAGGSGLNGLRERIERAGGTLTVSSEGNGQGLTLRAELDQASPRSAVRPRFERATADRAATPAGDHDQLAAPTASRS